MSVSAETYIVISLMFAVFAAVAAVGTSVVLGAGFERLRAGFEIVRKQSGFFADAIHRLDMRTQKIGEDTEKLKAGLSTMGERVDRSEKTATFLADSISSLEHRILEGTPIQAPPARDVQMKPRTVYTMPRKPVINVRQGKWEPVSNHLSVQQHVGQILRDAPETKQQQEYSLAQDDMPEACLKEEQDASDGLTTLISRYFMGENSGNGRGVVYH